MKKIFFLTSLIFSMVVFSSCSKDEFSIIGKWGMVSGTITNSDGSTNYYGPLESGNYYQYMEFDASGYFKKTTLPDYNVIYGVYTYNDANHSLQYKYNGDMYFAPAVVNVISSKEMNITTDWGSVGSMTQYFKKVE